MARASAALALSMRQVLAQQLPVVVEPVVPLKHDPTLLESEVSLLVVRLTGTTALLVFNLPAVEVVPAVTELLEPQQPVVPVVPVLRPRFLG
jgi:hypothetical protein